MKDGRVHLSCQQVSQMFDCFPYFFTNHAKKDVKKVEVHPPVSPFPYPRFPSPVIPLKPHLIPSQVLRIKY